jgi:acetyltransferase
MQTAVDIEFPDLTTLLSPRSVAVIGASDRAGNLGGDTVRRLVKFAFPGPVWPVNRSLEPVAGLAAHASVGDLPDVPDLAIFSIPASGLYDAISDCIAKGTRAGVAYAGGLAEGGTAEGIEMQNAIAKLCRDNGFMLCGPNCVGMINTALPVTSTFATALFELDSLIAGNISMVSQSGGIGTTALSIAEKAGFGFRHLVSSGNEAVVTFTDYLYAFAQDEGTDVIIGYLEGLTHGSKFIRALEEARRNGKPVILIKAGTNNSSALAAKAHTGSLVGEDSVFDAVFRELGVIRAYSVDEAVDVAMMISGDKRRRVPAGRGVGLVTFGGGNGVLGADQCGQNGLLTPQISAKGAEKLKPLLVSVASAANPMDLTPSTAFRPESLAMLPRALDVFAQEEEIHSVLFIVGSLASKAAEISEVIVDFWRRCDKPVYVAWPAPPNLALEKLAEKGIYGYSDQSRAIRAISLMAGRQEAVSAGNSKAGTGKAKSIDWKALTGNAVGPAVISEHMCHDILRAWGLTSAPGELATEEAGAVKIAASLGYPVVMKGISPAVTHRAAAGLLAVGLNSDAEVRDAFRRLDARAKEKGVKLDGLLVQKMEKGGVELLISAYRDPIFGPMVTCGSGGGLTELIEDVVTHRAPIDLAGAKRMIEALRVRRHAKDQEGLLPVDAAAEFLASFSELAAAAPFDGFVFEVNPIKWSRKAAVAVDGLLIVE